MSIWILALVVLIAVAIDGHFGFWPATIFAVLAGIGFVLGRL